MGGRLQETASKVELLCVLADCMNNHATNADNVGGGDHPAARVPDEPPPEAFASERLVDGQAGQGYHGNGMRHIPATRRVRTASRSTAATPRWSTTAPSSTTSPHRSDTHTSELHSL